MGSKFIYGRLSKQKAQSFKGGKVARFLSNFGDLKVSAFYLNVKGTAKYDDWVAIKDVENLCIVKKGSGKIVFKGKSYNLTTNHAFKVYPEQEPTIISRKGMSIVSTQRKSSESENKKRKVNIKKLEIVDTRKLKSKVYEFETLAKEVFTPKYKNGLGLIRFIFVNPIPIHRHPHSGRIILPTKGKGVTYVEPNVYEAHEDTFAVFDKNMTHTNGPLTGRKIHLDAVQMPWIPSGIDKFNVAGHPRFVKYIGVTPPRKLWKSKKGMEKLVKSLEV